ncbi:hypothetical protein HJ588_13110 [Flexivirga sp. ID2601S]|uniref:Uncharacterized protein n=1 Tax=Flexivirga aerilata TaxID=1656889 RepID=A0A849AID5_9MICO|nr:DUF5719 family protein [Flexivirga aerilata]NNG40205.1 hypothetical protein [Flexivirga aerilata]
MNATGIARAVVAVAVGAGMVWGAGQATGTVDTTRRSDARQLRDDATSSALRQVSLSCPGPDRAGAAGSGGQGQSVTVLAASAPAALLGGTGSGGASSGGTVTLTGAGGRTTDVAIRRGGVGSATVSGAVAPTLQARGGLAPGLAGSQAGLTDDSSGRGLTLAACGAPVRDGWLFGGGTDKGRVARLVVANPGATPVTVDAAVLGASGVDAGKSVKGTVLAPGERKVLVLGAFGPALASAAIHVTATGGGVVAALTDAWMSGETAVGEATAGPATRPAKSLVIPGVSASTAAPQVRVAVPGSEDAIVRVQAVSTSGAVAADTVQTVPAGSAGAVTLSGLAAGTYALRVTADVPVAAAALSRTGPTGTTDIAWAPAADAVAGLTGGALPTAVPGARSALMLVAPKGVTVDVQTVTAGGSHTSRVALRADRPLEQQLPSDVRAVWVRPAGTAAVHAAVTVRGKDAKGALLATMPLQPVSTSGTSVSMVPARD